MKNQLARAVFRLAMVTGFLLLLNSLLYHFTTPGVPHTFVYSLILLYSCFFLLSGSIIAVLHFINKRNKEQLGYAFLLLTAAKMAICYFLARPIIVKGEVASTEKINFFVIFIIFLVMEAYYTARLLNNKQ